MFIYFQRKKLNPLEEATIFYKCFKNRNTRIIIRKLHVPLEASREKICYRRNPFPYSNTTDPPTPCQGERGNASLKFYQFYMREKFGIISAHTSGACDSSPFQGAEGVFVKHQKACNACLLTKQIDPVPEAGSPFGSFRFLLGRNFQLAQQLEASG